MSVKSLLPLATVLCFGVIGCDDPEVQDRVGQILQHGAVVGRVTCHFSEDTVQVPSSSSPNLKHDIRYDASLMADGSCQASLQTSGGTTTVWNSYSENIGCLVKLHDDPVGPESLGNDWDLDVSKYHFSDTMHSKICKPSLTQIPSNPPFYTPICPWMTGCVEVTLAATTSEICYGFNLTKFDN